MRAAGVLQAAACLASVACRASPAPAPPDAAPAGTQPRGASQPVAESSRAHEARRPLPCRVIALEGTALVAPPAPGGAGGPGVFPAVRLQGDVPAGWITLGDATRLVAKDPRTARETTFRGPGRVRDCVGANEEAWVVEGGFESTAGAGEAPGAEEWVVTPHAVVRYAAAKLRVDVRPTGTMLTLVAGVAFVWPPAGSDAAVADEGWQRAGGGELRVLSSGTPKEALERCQTLAARARDLAAALLSPDGAAAGSGAVSEQVTTRRLARAACATAALRVDAVAPAERPADWSARLADADAAWRTLPIASTSR